MPTIRTPSKSKRRRRPTGSTRASGPSPSRADLYAMGKSLREQCPRQSHAEWKPPKNRRDPVELVESSDKGRIAGLVPIRHGRMLQTPFTFYRGAALNMAADLAGTPVSGPRVQACGDCHLCNFGAFATPERRVVFDINDLDETLPAPWEWDVKRLAASFVLACRNNGLGERFAREAAVACVRSYREQMAELSEMRVLDVWYAHMEMKDLIPEVRNKQARARIRERLADAEARSVAEHDFPKLAEIVDRLPKIRDNPPTIFHWREHEHDKFFAEVNAGLVAYRETLSEERRFLLDRYEVCDIAVKVVGVGSVGTWCGIVLLQAGEGDPLFLQIKEAGASVLEAYAGKSVYPNHGRRVVEGCRLLQSASDLFLGWTAGPAGRQFYVRQLKDVKIKMLVEVFKRETMAQYATLCGWTLARAHARCGEPATISGYLGKSDRFDEAVGDFSVAYADQSERDHESLTKAARDGRLAVTVEGE